MAIAFDREGSFHEAVGGDPVSAPFGGAGEWVGWMRVVRIRLIRGPPMRRGMP
jgi:hypothetical protein